MEFSNPAAYQRWMGRWSERLAPVFVAFADLPAGARLLDVGSGTGALSAALLEGAADSTVVGIEPAAAYVSYCEEAFADQRLSFEVGDALAIPFDDGSFDATLSLLILQELPDARVGLREKYRVTRPDGLVAASQWDFAKGMPMLDLFWAAVTEVVATEDARQRAADCMVVDYPDERALQRLWRETGLVEVASERHPVDMAFASFEDYWEPFLSRVSPTSSYVPTLPPEQGAEIKRLLRERTVGEAPDRPFTLTAHAWSIRGTVPK